MKKRGRGLKCDLQMLLKAEGEFSSCLAGGIAFIWTWISERGLRVASLLAHRSG